MAVKEDRRVRRTRQLLRDALFALIRERGYEALSVQDIIDRADIGRATFYAHYENKEDLFLSGFEGLRSSLKQRQREALARGGTIEERLFAFSYEMLAHAAEHRELFHAMAGERSGAVVQQILHKLIADLVRDDVKAIAARGSANAGGTEALVQFISGGFSGMLIWWLGAKTRPSVEELNSLFRRLSIPAVRATLREKVR